MTGICAKILAILNLNVPNESFGLFRLLPKLCPEYWTLQTSSEAPHFYAYDIWPPFITPLGFSDLDQNIISSSLGPILQDWARSVERLNYYASNGEMAWNTKLSTCRHIITVSSWKYWEWMPLLPFYTFNLFLRHITNIFRSVSW